MSTVLNQASAPPPHTGPYKVDISRGRRVGRVSSEWFSRPDDERYHSLRELHGAILARAKRATTRTIETRDVRVEASRDDAERLALVVPGRDEPVADALVVRPAPQPRGIIIFPGGGIQNNLFDKARSAGIAIIDHRRR